MEVEVTAFRVNSLLALSEVKQETVTNDKKPTIFQQCLNVSSSPLQNLLGDSKRRVLRG